MVFQVFLFLLVFFLLLACKCHFDQKIRRAIVRR